MTKGSIKTMILGAPAYVKEHWNKPNEGEYMPLKEVVAYMVTQSGSFVFSTVIGLMVFSAGYFCGAVMGIAAMDFYVIGLIGTVVGYVLMFMNPIGVLIYENHGILTKKTKVFAHTVWILQLLVGIGCYFIPSERFEFIMKGAPQILGNILVVGALTNYITWFIRRKFCAKYGRLKPFILICGIPAALVMSIIPFLPVQNMSYTSKLVVLHFAFTLMSYFVGNHNNNGGLVTFLTPNSQERQRLYSIIPIITSLIPSIIGIFFPILIGVTGGYLSLKTYKVFVPIFSFAGVAISFAVTQCKERLIEPPMEKRKQVKFWRGAKQVLQNKYLWIVNIAGVLGQWSYLVGSLLSWWFIYSLRMEWFSGIAANIVVLSMTLGNLLTPVLTKRFQKRTIILVARGLSLITILGMALAIRMESIVLFMAVLLIRNGIGPIEVGTTNGLNADILNYHQWRYGERADAMMGVFSWFLNPITMAIGFILPWISKLCGFTSDWDVLYDANILNQIFNIYIIGSFIGIIGSCIPFIFYDLTKEKHDMCVKELHERLLEEDTESEAPEVAVLQGEVL